MPQRLPPAAQPRSRRARSGSLRKGRQQEGAEGGERRGETGSYGGKLKRDFPVPGCRAGKGCCEWGDRGKGGREGRASRPVPGCSGRRGAVWRGGPGRSRGDGHHCKNLGESRGEGGEYVVRAHVRNWVAGDEGNCKVSCLGRGERTAFSRLSYVTANCFVAVVEN